MTTNQFGTKWQISKESSIKCKQIKEQGPAMPFPNSFITPASLSSENTEIPSRLTNPKFRQQRDV